MSNQGNLREIETAMRGILVEYQDMPHFGYAMEIRNRIHTALETTFILKLGDRADDFPTMSKKAKELVPDLYFKHNFGNINFERNERTHNIDSTAKQEYYANARKFVNFTLDAWPQLYGTTPPTVTHPTYQDEQTKTREEPEGQKPEKQIPKTKLLDRARRYLQPSRGNLHPWRSLFFGLIFLWPAIFLAGFLSSITSDLRSISWVVLLIPFGIFLLCSFLSLRYFLRFLRGVGAKRLITTIAVVLFLGTLVMVFLRPSQSNWTNRASQGLYQVLNLLDSSTRQAAASTFATGEDIAQGVVTGIENPQGDISEQTALGNGSASADQSGATGSKNNPDAPIAPSTNQSQENEIGIGSRVKVRTDGTRLRGRDAPGLNTAIVIYFKFGEELTVVDGPIEVENYTWWKVQNDEGTGWSAADLLVLIEDE